MILNIYIEGKKLELFQDETVSLIQSIQNIKDISKVFTDFTQSFSVPASSVNSKIFEHWYNADITGGFNAKVRKTAILELNYMPFKTGKIQLDGVQLKNGKAYAYKITFFGDLLNLSDLFGDDKLSDLTLTTYDHDYTSANVKEGIINGLSKLAGETAYSIIYPMICNTTNWNWDSQGLATLEDTDIQYFSGTTVGASWREFKPAIKINRIIEAIESKYSISFVGDFFGTKNNHVDFLYLYLNKEKGQIQAYSDLVAMFSSVVYNNTRQQKDNFVLKVTPAGGYETVPYRITVTTAGDATDILAEIDLVGETSSDMNGFPNYPDYISLQFLGAGTYDIYISSILPFQFSFARWVIYDQGTSGILGTVSVTNGNTTTANNMPDMKLTDFLGALVKMFNLVIEPLSSVIFNIKPLDEWYLDGTSKDISSYIDITESEIDKPKLWRRIDYKYEETDSVNSKNFFETNKRGYGDLESEFTYDGDVLEVKIPFENPMWDRLVSDIDSSLSDMHVLKLLEVNEDSTVDTVDVKPFIFYNRMHTNLTTGFSFVNDDGTISEVTRYQNCGQENKIIRDDVTNSLNFGNELSTWDYLSPITNPNSDGSLVYSLYSVFWEDYITDVYDNKRREYKYKAVLPLSVIVNLKLNDILC